jgi:circadian clock protein KaiC
MLQGGFLAGSSILLRGAPGTGKTTLALQFLQAGMNLGEPGLFISFEEFPASLRRDAASLGWDLPALEAGGGLSLLFTSPEVLLQGMQAADSPILRLITQRNIRRVALDSATHFARLASDEHSLRRLYRGLINALKREEITSLLLAEESRPQSSGPREGRLDFVVDAIIFLIYLEIDSAIQRALLVPKMRGSAHSREIRGYRILPGVGLALGKAFEGRQGLLSGLARQGIISSVR